MAEQKIISCLPLKGGRTYLHGTDIFNWLCGILQARGVGLAPFSLSFHRMIHSQLELVEEGKQPPEGSPAAVCAAEGFRGALYETEIVPTEKIPYDEDSIGRNCVVDGTTIRVQRPQQYTPIEVLVAMTKALHLTHFAEEKRKWVFARLELAHALEESDRDSFEVKIIQSIQSRFTKSQIISHRGELGFIYFSIHTA